MHGDFGGLSAADTICQAHATDAGLPGTFRAFLSSSTASFQTRLGSARGWVRTDGKPFADTLGGLFSSGQIFYPLVLDEHQLPATKLGVWTGVLSDGGLGLDCADWTRTDGGITAQAGTPYRTSEGWVANAAPFCSSSQALYCFGITSQLPVAPTPPIPHRLAFITAGSYVFDGGRAQADAICAGEAADAGLSGQYLALLSTTDAGSAYSRFDTVGGTWTRVDGTSLASSPALFLTWDGGSPDCTISVTATGLYLQGPTFGPIVWPGATAPNQTGTDITTCFNWTNPSAFIQGNGWANDYGTASWWDVVAFGSGCSQAHHLYCLQH